MKMLTYLIIVLPMAAIASGIAALPKEGWSEDFSSFEGTYSSLPQGMSVSKDGNTTMTDDDDDFRGIDDGNLATGGCYAWTLNRDRALGYQPTSSEFTPGYIEACFSNSSHKTYNYLKVEYDVVSLNNEDRSSSLSLKILLPDSPPLTMDETEFITEGPQDTNAVWQRIHIRHTARLHSPVPTNGTFRLQWHGDDAGGSGSRDEYGIDNIHVCGVQNIGMVITVR